METRLIKLQKMETTMALLFLLHCIMFVSVNADDTCPGLPKCFCNKDKTSVNCEGKHFAEVPDTIPNTVEKLYLRYNNIAEIRTDAFSSLHRLEKLWLNGNRLTTIEPFAFRNLSNLKYLDLQDNKLITLGNRSLAGMPRLETLYLTTNLIQIVTDEAFFGTTMLKSLYLQSNQLKTIPDFGSLPFLEKLILEGNQITDATFPESYKNCTSLSYLVLSNNKISELSADTFKALTNNSMSTLYVSRNGIRTATAGVFSPFRGIKSLKLGFNPLDSTDLKLIIESLQGKDMVSLDLSNLTLSGKLLEDTFVLLKNTSITSLSMRLNKIAVLPKHAFAGLDKLLHLDLSGCSMADTDPEAFVGLNRLTILNLEKNKLVDVPKNLPTTLDKLFMDNNQVTGIPKFIFKDLGRLQELRIQYNKILTLEQDSFAGLTSLNILSLYDNQIATLPGKVFVPLVRMTQLSLAKNNLKSIQQTFGRFASQSSLVYLNLRDNDCSYLQPDFFRGLTSLRYLHLEGNDLGQLISEDYGGALFKELQNLRELHLMGNGITHLPEGTFQNLGNLVMLNLSRNVITGWGDNLFKTPQKLEAVDLSFNLITNLKYENLKDLAPTMKTINLTGNPFVCDCDLRWFRDWMNKTSIELANNASYTCHDPKEWKNRSLLSFDRTKINCVRLTWWEIVAACAVVAVIVIIIFGVSYRKRWWIKLFIYKRMRKSKARKLRAADGHGNYGAIVPDEELERPYDAYISCAQEDYEWVLNHLLPGIDSGEIKDHDVKFGGEFALYFEYRDSVPGRSIAGNIFENMSLSRKVIVVLSRNYLNAMNKFELDLATNLMYEKRLENIIIIHISDGLPLDKIPRHLMHTMKRNELLEWTPDRDAQELVKAKVKELLSQGEAAVDQGAE